MRAVIGRGDIAGWWTPSRPRRTSRRSRSIRCASRSRCRCTSPSWRTPNAGDVAGPHRARRRRTAPRLDAPSGDVDAVRPLPGLARQARRARGARRRGQRDRSLRAPADHGATSRRFDRAFAGRQRSSACARSSTTPTRSTTRPARPTGRRGSSTSSRSAAATTCGATCRRSSSGDRIGRRARRVLVDYRETSPTCCSTRFTTEWPSWAHARGSIVRNQAHGSPASILDLYAASDIPETEGTELYTAQVGHVRGARRRQAAGVGRSGDVARRALRHARCRRARRARPLLRRRREPRRLPRDERTRRPSEPWPGWPFYAAVEFDPQNPWWGDFAALNAYATRVQSFLQSGQPDNDVLLYFPLHDALAMRGPGLLAHFGPSGATCPGRPFRRRVRHAGAPRLRLRLRVRPPPRRSEGHGGGPGDERQPVPGPRASRCARDPSRAFARALDLVREGATVIAYRSLPADVPGLHDLEGRRARFGRLTEQLAFAAPDARGVSEARLGRGRVLGGTDLEALLEEGGRCARATGRSRSSRSCAGVTRADGTTSWRTQGRIPCRAGWAWRRRRAPWPSTSRCTGAAAGRRYARPGPAGSRCTSSSRRASHLFWRPIPPAQGGEGYRYVEAVGRAGDDRGSMDGAVRAGRAGSARAGHDIDSRFLDALRDSEAPRLLGHGDLHDHVCPAGRPGGGLAARPGTGPGQCARAAEWPGPRDADRPGLRGDFAGTLLAERNVLEIDVTNQMANRIADLDRRHVPWKKFYNVNFPARLRENRGPDGLFSAAGWEPLESACLGPVTLQPVRIGAPSRCPRTAR